MILTPEKWPPILGEEETLVEEVVVEKGGNTSNQVLALANRTEAKTR